MSFLTAPLNAKEPMVDQHRRPTSTFLDWVTALSQDVDAAPAGFAPTSVTGQTATISTTPIIAAALSAGLYRVTWYARITTAATTGAATSSLTMTVYWTDGVSCSYTGAAMTGNTTATTQSDTQMIRVDSATPVSYSAAYASDTAAEMTFSLALVLEQVSA